MTPGTASLILAVDQWRGRWDTGAGRNPADVGCAGLDGRTLTNEKPPAPSKGQAVLFFVRGRLGGILHKEGTVEVDVESDEAPRLAPEVQTFEQPQPLQGVVGSG